MAVTSTLRRWWAPYRCEPDRMQPIALFGRNAGRIPPETLDAYTALETVLTDAGYKPVSVWTYNCRKIGGSTNWSLHSYGIAVDIDPALNPFSYGDPFELGAFKPRHIEPVEAIRNIHDEQVWMWGGRWSRPDRMHFQINVPPDRCQIDWDTVEGDDNMSDRLQAGDTGNTVAKMQQGLNGWIDYFNVDTDPLKVDGIFGAETVDLVERYQAAADLPVTSVVGGIMYASLMEYVPDRIDKPTQIGEFEARIVPL